MIPVSPQLLAFIRDRLDDATHIAVDANGALYAYDTEPNLDTNLGVWGDNGATPIGNRPEMCEVWAETLTALPDAAKVCESCGTVGCCGGVPFS